MTFIDTCYLVAIAIAKDELHQRALAWSNRLPGPFLTTEYVLWEFLNALSDPPNRVMAHATLAGLRENPAVRVIPASADPFESGVAMHARTHDKGWSLTDCISFVVMRRERITESLTYDHNFAQASFRVLLREEL